MGLLQYTSNEMFSATELIRKSKLIFDKLNNNEIEKAIILRDGKPSFMLLDFNKYENLINEYLLLKEQLDNTKANKNHQSNISKKDIENTNESIQEINDDDLKDALAKIDELDFELDKQTISNDKNEALKEFWD